MSKRKVRSLSENGLLSKLKLRQKRNKSKGSPSSSDKNNTTVSRSSLSTKKSSKNRKEVAKRRILSDLPANASSSNHIELPEIVSIKSAGRGKSTISSDGIEDTESEAELSFKPRRSLQNSTGGIKRKTGHHGYFNIPVTLDNQSTKSKVASRQRSEDASTKDVAHLNIQRTPSTIDKSVGSPSTSIFGTIMSIAHNAVSHVPKITVNESNGLDKQFSTGSDEDSHIVANSTLSDINDANNDTVLHSTLPTRSASFLRHLDHLLSVSNQSPSGQFSTTSEAETNQYSATNVSAPTMTESKVSIDDLASVSSQLPQSPVTKVKFQSVSTQPPAVTTLGNGNLSLDIFGNGSNVDDSSINDEALSSRKNTIISSNHHLNSLLSLQEKDHSKLSLADRIEGDDVKTKSILESKGNRTLENVLTSSRARSKTLPVNQKVIIKNQDDKRNSRYSSVSNDEALDMENRANERKSRSMSKNILNRRSFSPTNLGLKVIPNISFRNSISKTRNSNEQGTNIPSISFVTSNNNVSTNAAALNNDDASRSATDTILSDGLDRDIDIDDESFTELEGIEYASEKKNAEFHNLFKDTGLGPNEKLIIDHSCALSRDILLQGRMYISNQHICFYSNILGWVSTVFIPFKEIVQIEKKTTAGIFPNGIVIDTLHTKYIFASFISRDSTFDLITDVWNQIILGKSFKSRDNGDFQGGYSSDSDISNLSEFYDDIDNNDSDTEMTSSDDLDDDGFSALPASKNSKSSAGAKFGPSKHAPTEANYKLKDKEKLVSETIIDAPLGTVAHILYGDDTTMLYDIITAQKNFDISSLSPLIGSNTRVFTYYKPISFGFGPSKTKCHISETLEHYDLNEYVEVSQVSRTPDVPSGGSFSINTSTVLTWDKNNTTKVTVYFLVNWTAKSWIKGAIEKASYDGVIDTTKVMNNEISTFVKEKRVEWKPSKEGSVKGPAKQNHEEEYESTGLPTLGPAVHAPTKVPFKKEKDDVIIQPGTNIAAPLGTVFQLLYGDDTSFMRKVLENQDNVDISEIPKFINNERSFNYIKNLNASIGPKQTKCIVTEKIEHLDTNDYIAVRNITKSPDVPYGNSFSVHTRTYLSWAEDNSTNMMVVSNIPWTGKSILRGPIERGTIEGQKVANGKILGQIKDVIANSYSMKKKTTKKRQSKAKTNKVKALEVSTRQDAEVTQASSISPILDIIGVDSIKKVFAVFFSLFLLFMLYRFIFHSSRGPNVEIIRPGRVVIDGNEYNYVPNIKTLYQVYEDDVRKNKNSKENLPNIVTETEDVIWDWLDNRGDGLLKHSRLFPKEETSAANVKSRRIQQLIDSIQITEMQLDEMKKMLASIGEQS
ncbi:hypothetical protein KAFR_0D04410 [Kazachstania africana CBS 2517]|uniref:VASt domain-containing protein n=1 Tax=Kazachstania africana (strain ATCC 22294 / BCRC 22015 / CBS 2517 / CECT 1963 / NBRC 1671 / NRRL Y-8276) TaxID=1071382 RepID=H2AUN9_KAZAF|nr:hypothetical protein KAFR_0D04410 [Kazachstania africana CBS 2517]CCF58089.1 hypothetical protein KAFR_0D04410 [Kazachstania africana CBS 2517]